MRVYWGTDPRFAVSAATLTYECRCRLWVWLVLLVTSYSSGPFCIIFDMNGSLTKGGSRILKWGVNFRNNVREIKYYFNIRGGLMVSALVSGSSGPGSSPGRGHCVLFLGKTLYSHSASLHPGVQMGTSELNAGG